MAVYKHLLPIILLFNLFFQGLGHESGNFSIVISTWPFVDAVRAAWKAVESGLSAVDAVVEGCSACEELKCDGTVGPGGSPDENGETTLDALIMNGATMEVGAVASMRYVKDGIRAARLVMDHTEHTMLVGEQASIFAISMGLSGPTNLSSIESLEKWAKWKGIGCAPNFRKNVLPINGCGPYHPKASNKYFIGDSVETVARASSHIGIHNHDTISMAVVDKMGKIAVGTSTNGATFKIPGSLCFGCGSSFINIKGVFERFQLEITPNNYSGSFVRVGDGPIAGSSSYADNDVGACGATGDGDIMMRFLPCYQVVESMRLGMKPEFAAKDAISRIARKYPNFVGAVFAVNKIGIHAGACHGWTFQYSVRNPEMDDVNVFTVSP